MVALGLALAVGFSLGALWQRRRARRIEDASCRRMADEYRDLLRWMPSDVLARYWAARAGVEPDEPTPRGVAGRHS